MPLRYNVVMPVQWLEQAMPPDIRFQQTTTKADTRAKVYELEQELKETQHLKDVFLQQVIQLQKN